VRETPEQLKKLLESVLDPETVDQAGREMECGLDLLRDNPVPGPDPARIAALKLLVQSKAARHSKTHRRIWIGWAVSAAAVFLAVGAWVAPWGIQWYASRPTASIHTLNPWKLDSDPTLRQLARELGEVLDENLSINPEHRDIDAPETIELAEQQLKMLATSDDFWKG
jgi:hypothetical protein